MWLTILIVAVAIFAFGALWFTVLFGKTWGRLMDFNPAGDAKAREMGMAKPLVMNFITNVIIASVIYWLAPQLFALSFSSLIHILFIVWLGFSFPIYANAAIWERKSWKLVVINCAQSLIALLIASAIIFYMQ